jgi:hypothetical protein
MTHISTKIQCLFMAATVFLCPLLVIADSACRCPDCARRVCVVKSRACACKDCSEASDSCCSRDSLGSQGSEVLPEPTQDVNQEKSGHQSPSESKGCHCNAYIYTHGNAILPLGDANASLAAEEFHELIPKTVITSGWVYQILHPPRQFNA